MAIWYDEVGEYALKWCWRKKRVWNPFTECQHTKTNLFLKPAYFGECETLWDLKSYTVVLSEHAYTIAILKGMYTNAR